VPHSHQSCNPCFCLACAVACRAAVYRSNWLGAEGHEERKKKKQHQKEAGAQL
jgi:hypothetical protein